MIETIQHENLQWHHILNPTERDLKVLENDFHFHPLDIEDCRSKTQRPKIDVYDDYYFIILHFPNFDTSDTVLVTKEIKIFWGKDYIITIGTSPWKVRDLFNCAKENEKMKNELMGSSSDILLYHIMERLMNESFSILSRIGNEVELINKSLFDKRSEKTIERICITRRNIILLDTIFKPQLRLFHKFESGEIKGYAEDMEEYWGNILDSYQKTWDVVEDYGDLIKSLSTTFDSLQANRTNEIMRVLTFISTTLLPLTFITGLYGMNIGLPFQNHPFSFWIVVGFMAIVVVVLILFFKKRKWM